MRFRPTQTEAWRTSLRVALLLITLGVMCAVGSRLGWMGGWSGDRAGGGAGGGAGESVPSVGTRSGTSVNTGSGSGVDFVTNSSGGSTESAPAATEQLESRTASEGMSPGSTLFLASLVAAGTALLVGWMRGRASIRMASVVADSLAGVETALSDDRSREPALTAPTALSAREIDESELPAELALVAGAGQRALDDAGRRLEDLERLSREQQTILETMHSGLLALDPEQRVLRVNRAAADMLGLDRARVRGRLVQAVTRQPGLNRFLSESLIGDATSEGEFIVDRDGRPRMVVHAVSEPLRDSSGRPAGLLVSLSDVTTLRRLESLRADFAANVSHELRTPITNIKGYADTLLQVGVSDPAQTSRFLEVIRRNAHRLGAIIEDLLALARLEQPGEREELQATAVPIRDLVQAVREDLEIAAQAKSMAIVDATPGGLRAKVVASLAQQALANLVSNAITYSPAGGEVRITASVLSDGMVEIAVTDHGQGIAPHHLGRIFERFYRIDRARSRDQGGTGLGLAIVKHIALLHGGRVDVESRMGVGSTFRLILPAAEASASSAAGGGAGGAQANDGGAAANGAGSPAAGQADRGGSPPTKIGTGASEASAA